jgi:hypothetical protein
MDCVQCLYGFQFDQDTIIDQQIGCICADDGTSMMDGNFVLLFH